MTEPKPKRVYAQYPLAVLAAAFSGGILFAHWFPTSLIVLAALIIVCGVAAFIGRRSGAGSLFVIFAFFILGAVCLSLENRAIRGDRLRVLIDSGSLPSGEPVEIEGRVVGAPESMPDGVLITVAAEKIIHGGRSQTASGNARLFVSVVDERAESDLEDLDLQAGSRIVAACNLVREEQYINPGVPSRIELLDREGIDATATVKSPLLIEKLGGQTGLSPFRWVYGLRRSLIDDIRAKFSPSTAGVLMASMLGDKYFLDKDTADVFREGGTFHVLVISGLHITFIGGLVLLVASAFTRKRSVQFAVVCSLLWSYTLAVGANPPVVRASMMFTVLLFSRVVYRQSSLLNALGLCVLLLLAWRPSDIFNTSFQLTIVSVAAIVTTAFPLIEKLRAIGSWVPGASAPFPPNVTDWLRRFCEMLYWQPAAWNIEISRQVWTARIFKSPFVPRIAGRFGQALMARVVEGLIVSMIAQAWMLPFLVIYFHRVTPVSVFMNLWVGAVMAGVSISAIAGVAISHFSNFLGAPFILLAEFLNYLIAVGPSKLVSTDWASWRVPNYSGAESLVYIFYYWPIGVLTLALWHWDPFALVRQKLELRIVRNSFGLNSTIASAAIAVAAVALIIGAHPLSEPRADGRFHIDFLDVGQGDSALITFPDGQTMLVDGGGRMEFRGDDETGEDVFEPDRPGIGEAVVSPVLWQKGYSSIDYILATHADADHIQGLADVAKNFQVGEALFGRMPAADPEFQQLSAVLGERGVPAHYVSRGQQLKFGGATIEVLYPRSDPSADAPSDNNDSVVLRIAFGSRSFLLTGDIEREAENDLAAAGGLLRADVIKVPHHGSRTSSTQEFVDRVGAKYAVISVGRHSRFGHPNIEVVNRWRAAGAEVMTTGERGMVSVSTDGIDLEVSTYPK